MKFESKQEPKTFRKITVSFTIETQKELDALNQFFAYDVTIPRYAEENKLTDDFDTINSFFMKMSSALNQV